MQIKASDEVRLTINLGPTVFSQLNEEASVLDIPTVTLAASYVEEHFERERFAADCEAEIEKLKKELADYKQHHQREIESLTTELTRLKAALDFETEEVARLKATSARFL
jgi:predicted RNase H-like nuclease (RuvC/YqgF family)